MYCLTYNSLLFNFTTSEQSMSLHNLNALYVGRQCGYLFDRPVPVPHPLDTVAFTNVAFPTHVSGFQNVSHHFQPYRVARLQFINTLATFNTNYMCMHNFVYTSVYTVCVYICYMGKCKCTYVYVPEWQTNNMGHCDTL